MDGNQGPDEAQPRQLTVMDVARSLAAVRRTVGRGQARAVSDFGRLAEIGKRLGEGRRYGASRSHASTLPPGYGTYPISAGSMLKGATRGHFRPIRRRTTGAR